MPVNNGAQEPSKVSRPGVSPSDSNRAIVAISSVLASGPNGSSAPEMPRKLGEAVDIYVNNRLIARGEVVMVEDNRIGITMTEIVKSDRPG